MQTQHREEIPLTPVEPVFDLRGNRLWCVICNAPAAARCSVCKFVGYCSFKCQGIDWRKGHENTCQRSAIAADANNLFPNISAEVKRKLVFCKVDVDNRLSLRYYYRKVDSLIQQADIHRAKGKIVYSYSILIGLSSLITETIPDHWEFHLSPRSEINHLRLKLLTALDELETLNPDVQRLIAKTKLKPTSPNTRAQPKQDHSSNPYVCPPIKKPAPPLQEHDQVSRDNATIEEARQIMDGTMSENCPQKHAESIKKSGESPAKSDYMSEKPQYVPTNKETRRKTCKETKRLEENLAKKSTELERLKRQQDEVLKEHKILKNMQNDMEKEIENLRQQIEERASINYDEANLMEFSYLELKEATHNFDENLKIGEGGYGSVYKAVLHCTTVAIKVLHSQGNQGKREFYQEVRVLKNIRHPNIVALIGGCSQNWALVYDFIPNGSLENYLSTPGGRKSLSWKTRIQIPLTSAQPSSFSTQLNLMA